MCGSGALAAMRSLGALRGRGRSAEGGVGRWNIPVIRFTPRGTRSGAESMASLLGEGEA